MLGHEARRPDQHVVTVDGGLHAVPGTGRERADGPEAKLVQVGAGDDRGGQGVLAATLGRRRQVQHVPLRPARLGRDRLDGRAAQGQRARLVEDDGVRPADRLERLGAPEEDARLGGPPRADHDGRGGGQAHGARAGDHDDADEGRERERQVRFRTRREPDDERRAGDDQDQRHEDLADTVGEALQRHLGALGPFDEVDDRGQDGVPPDARGPHHEGPGRVERRPDDRVAGRLVHRRRLTGEHRFVDRRGALDDHAIDRHPLARPHTQQVADAHDLQQHVDLLPVLQASRGAWLQPDEAADGVARLALGPRLEPPPEQHQPDDDGRTVEVRLRLPARPAA